MHKELFYDKELFSLTKYQVKSFQPSGNYCTNVAEKERPCIVIQTTSIYKITKIKTTLYIYIYIYIYSTSISIMCEYAKKYKPPIYWYCTVSVPD